MRMNSFVFYMDPGHGWLAVPLHALSNIGLGAVDFTQCSHIGRGGTVLYLEEDCDAPKFIAAFRDQYGYEPRITERYIDDTEMDGECFIRRLPRNVAGQWKPFAR